MDPTREGQEPRFEGATTSGPEVLQEQKPPAEMPGLSEGRIVHYVLQDGAHRPAIIVRNWNSPGGCCNMQVFLDGVNDEGITHVATDDARRGMQWCTSILYSAKPQPGTWHWPEMA